MLTVNVSRLWAKISSIPLVVLIDRDLSPREAIKQGMFNARSHTHDCLQMKKYYEPHFEFSQQRINYFMFFAS